MKIDSDFSMIITQMYSNINLTILDINLYGLIITLSNVSGSCPQTNEYFSIHFNVPLKSITESISRLKRLDYINIKYNDQRLIYPVRNINFFN